MQVRTDLNTEVNAVMTSETFVGQEVIVQATQDVVIKDLTSSEARVNRDQIEKLPVQEVGDIIQLQAGVTVGPVELSTYVEVVLVKYRTSWMG